MDERADEVSGRCHCGAVRFTVRLTDGLNTARRCTCSYCSMRGAVAVSADRDDLRIEAGEALLTEYRFNTGTARHWFCSRCGIYTHHLRRSNPRQACLDGLGPFASPEVPVLDGVHHPADTAGGSRLAGMLRFVPSSDR